MQIHDLSGKFESDDANKIAERLRSVRQGDYGAFFIAGDSAFPYIAVHFHGDIAYVHYFPSDGHPGYQPENMGPHGVSDNVRFLNLDGSEASAFDMPASALVDTETAISAVLEFADNGKMPRSINWFEL